jgi:pilus assembly protein CpaE
MDRLRVLLASRSQTALDKLQACIAGHSEFECTTRLISNGHTDPLHGLPHPPDVLVLRFDPCHMTELAALAEASSTTRPPLIVVGPPVNAEAMRLAIRSGAKDFLVEPLQPEDVIAALHRIQSELRRESSRAGSQIDVVIGAAGGVGTSFIACNLAHLTAAEAKRSCLLLDLDLNYAPLAHFLDVHPERGLIEALQEAETLDEHAIPGYVAKHRSGLHVMSTVQKTVVLSRDVHADRLAALLGVLGSHYQHILVDSPHQIDTHNAAVLGMARTVLVVLQQSVLHVKNASRLLHILSRELAVPRERIKIVVNRFSKRSAVQLEDIQRALDASAVVTVPNHYRLSLDSIDTATPLFEIDKDAAVARSLFDLQAEIGARDRATRTGLLSRLPLFARRQQ